jgi:hypothetical protein
VKEAENHSLIQAVRAALEFLGGTANTEDIRVHLAKTMPQVLNGARVVGMQRRMIAEALRHDQGGLPYAYAVGEGKFRQRALFERENYLVVCGGLVVQSRKDIHQAEKLIAEAQERGFDLSMDDADRWADDHWNDPDADDE